MRAWQTPGDGTLDAVEVATPEPAQDEVLVRVRACGVCRTDLHVVDGELPVHRLPVVPGHEVVGVVEEVGARVTGIAPGARVGLPWLRSTCGSCAWCLSGAENLCRFSTYTGWDADGGYAEYTTAPAAFVYELPDLPDEQVAPLLCAGVIGYRALRRASLPPGGCLGLYGFGASAHLTAQVALAQGAQVHVMTRDPGARRLALDLGASSARGATDAPPRRLDAAIVFAPAGEIVPAALAALEQGGTCVVAGIHLSDIPALTYQTHLFRERTLTSVTSSTRSDGIQLLRLAPRLGVRAIVTPYRMSRADVALRDLAADRVRGAAVLMARG